MAAATSTEGDMQGMREQLQPDTAFTAPATAPVTAIVTLPTVEQLLSSIPGMYNPSSLPFPSFVVEYVTHTHTHIYMLTPPSPRQLRLPRLHRRRGR